MSQVGYQPDKPLDQLAKRYGEFVRVSKIQYNKKVAIVYNPNSGKKRDVRTDIIKILNERKIEYQFYETKGFMDAWKIA